MSKLQPQPGNSLFVAGVRPVLPGDFLEKQFLEPRHLKPSDAARAIGIGVTALKRVLQGGRVDKRIAGRLAHFTGTTEGFWLNMQAAADAQVMRDAQAASEARGVPSGPVDESD